MSENPSSCIVAEDEVTFSNSDHLEWNQKKHDMMLNLGLTNNSSEADQTPTPTRFIRNCEEVGLFQDLQNVNPFDEVFKKAVENPASVSLKVPVSSSDDTLHTPQIYPHLEENPKFSSTTADETSVYSLSGVLASIEQERDDGENPLIIVENDEQTVSKHNDKNETNTSPMQITTKETSRDKLKQKVIAAIMQKNSGGLTPIPIDRLIDHEKQKPTTSQENVNMAELLRQREANKASQTRCRKRKQREFDQMSTEIQKLKKENSELTGMNLYLQETVKRLEAELKATQSLSSLEQSTQDYSSLASTFSSPSATSPIVLQAQSSNNTQVELATIGSEVNVTIPPKPIELSQLRSIAPNVKTVVVAAPNPLTLPVQNSSNNTLVVLYPGGYVPSQNIIIPPGPLLTQPVGFNAKSKAKTNYKKIVPK